MLEITEVMRLGLLSCAPAASSHGLFVFAVPAYVLRAAGPVMVGVPHLRSRDCFLPHPPKGRGNLMRGICSRRDSQVRRAGGAIG